MAVALELLNLHAQGGMAEVYRARAVDERGRSTIYAVKRILPELVADPEVRNMFIAEQRIAARLVHDNIVRVFDVAASDGGDSDGAYIVMEFLEGRDVDQMIEVGKGDANAVGAPAAGALPPWLAMHIARETLHALDYANERAVDNLDRPLRLVHRDVSPHNIFVTTSGDVKLMDFGVARVANPDVKTRAGVIKGKFGYMSPEQLTGQQLDGRSDIYNIGIVLYEMLTGQRLFYGESATQFVAAMMRNVVPPFAKALGVPPDLDDLVRRALAKRKDDRPATARAMAAELEEMALMHGMLAGRDKVADELRRYFPELAPLSDRTTEPVPVKLVAQANMKLPPVKPKRLTVVEENVFRKAMDNEPPPASSALTEVRTVAEAPRAEAKGPAAPIPSDHGLPDIDSASSTEPIPTITVAGGKGAGVPRGTTVVEKPPKRR